MVFKLPENHYPCKNELIVFGVAVKELSGSYYGEEALFCTRYLEYDNLSLSSSTTMHVVVGSLFGLGFKYPGLF